MQCLWVELQFKFILLWARDSSSCVCSMNMASNRQSERASIFITGKPKIIRWELLSAGAFSTPYTSLWSLQHIPYKMFSIFRVFFSIVPQMFVLSPLFTILTSFLQIHSLALMSILFFHTNLKKPNNKNVDEKNCEWQKSRNDLNWRFVWEFCTEVYVDFTFWSLIKLTHKWKAWRRHNIRLIELFHKFCLLCKTYDNLLV